MDESIAYAQRTAAAYEDAWLRHGAASRRWMESADEARVQWDDAAGRQLQQQWLDPFAPLIDGVQASARTAIEGQRAALDRTGRAVDAAHRAADATGRAIAAVRQSFAHASAAQSEISTALAESSRTHQLASDVSDRVASLG